MDADMQKRLAKMRVLMEAKEAEKNQQTQDDEHHSVLDNSVTKSNELARAHYRFNLPEKRVMEAMVSQLDPRLFNEHQTQDIELKTTEYAKAFDITEKSAYREMEGAIDALLKRVITTKEEYKGRPAIVKRPLMFRGVYEEGKGRIIASFHPDFVVHLIGLRQKFATYPLSKAVNFKSSYTWRLFEIMVSWAQDKKLTGGVLTGWFSVSVDELRQQLGMPDSYLWVNVDRTIEASVKELREKARIHTKIERIKTSRKITHLRFEFIEDLQQDLLEGV